MSQKPRKTSSPKPVEVVGQTLERAFDPLASALKRAALKRADRQARQFSEAPAAAAATPAPKGPLVSPLAVPFPAIPPIAGVELATGRAGFYKTRVVDEVWDVPTRLGLTIPPHLRTLA